MPYVPAKDEPERYLKLLIASPAHRGEQIGHRLIERARDLVLAAGIGLLRVDCWSGGDRRLVAYYTSEGFTPTEEIEVRPGTSVQVVAVATRDGMPLLGVANGLHATVFDSHSLFTSPLFAQGGEIWPLRCVR
jgi:predicted N-acetyltransferase YhbS